MAKKQDKVSLTTVVANNVRAYAAKRRMTYADVAEKMTQLGHPIGTGTVTTIVSGRRRSIGVDEVDAFARAFEVDFEDLLVA